MKRYTMILLSVLLLIGVSACGNDSPKAAMGDMVDLFDGYIADMDKADNADDVVKAIEGFSDGMQKLVPRMKELQEKYPELKGGLKGELPAEFKEFEDRLKELAPKIMGTVSKMMQYGSDPRVQAATKKFQEAMSKMN